MILYVAGLKNVDPMVLEAATVDGANGWQRFWRITFPLLAPITTKPWREHIPQLKDAPAPSQEMRDSQLLFNEPKYIRLDDGDIHTLESNGLEMKEGVYY